MNKRPKSREETPKEGSDNARSATAPQQYATALHKMQGLWSYFRCIIDRLGTQALKWPAKIFFYYFN